MTLATLTADIQSWVNRTDAAFVAKIPQFISLAEDDIYADLRCKHNEFTVTYDTASVANAHKLLPENFKEIKLITWNGAPLDPASEQEVKTRIASNYDLAPAVHCLVERQLLISKLDDDPANWDEGSELEITYWGTESLNDMPVYQTPTNPVDSTPTEATETAITQSDTNTTRLLQHFPNIYLSGTLHYALLWLQKPDQAGAWAAKFNQALERLKREEKRGQMAGANRGVNPAYGDE